MLRLLRLWRVAGRDLRLLWFALRHPGRPMWLWPAALAIGVYALEPFNVVFPLVGVIDDLILLPFVLHGVLRLLPVGIRSDFDRPTVVY